MASHDERTERVEWLREQFPETFTEGRVDFDRLKAALRELGTLRRSLRAAPPLLPAKGKAEQAEKIVRDSYTVPPKEYETITKVQQRRLKRGLVVSKSEVVRAGFAALGTPPDRDLFALTEGLVKVKTDRPPE